MFVIKTVRPQSVYMWWFSVAFCQVWHFSYAHLSKRKVPLNLVIGGSLFQKRFDDKECPTNSTDTSFTDISSRPLIISLIKWLSCSKATILDKTTWESFPHHVHSPTQQNYFQNDAFAERKLLPPIQCCFPQTPRDQAFFWIHNNIAFRGRGRGKNRYKYDV